MAANGPVSVRYQGVVMKSFYGHVLIGVLGLMYFCSSGVILPAANVVNPLMLQDASLGLNGTLLGMGFSLFVLFQGLSAPVIGALIARMGARFTLSLIHIFCRQDRGRPGEHAGRTAQAVLRERQPHHHRGHAAHQLSLIHI